MYNTYENVRRGHFPPSFLIDTHIWSDVQICCFTRLIFRFYGESKRLEQFNVSFFVHENIFIFLESTYRFVSRDKFRIWKFLLVLSGFREKKYKWSSHNDSEIFAKEYTIINRVSSLNRSPWKYVIVTYTPFWYIFL